MSLTFSSSDSLQAAAFSSLFPNATISTSLESTSPEDKTFLTDISILPNPLDFFYVTTNVYFDRKPAGKTEKEDCPCHREPLYQGPQPCLSSSCSNLASMTECLFLKNSVDCGNQRLQRKQWARLRVISCPPPIGYGLITCVPIRAHELVCEYVGEVISSEKYEKRTEEYAPSDKFYVFDIPLQKEVIDATKIGGIARFINHCCAPNCAARLWQVRGESRIGIFALTNILEGEEITIDYKRVGRRIGLSDDSNSTETQKCYCKAGVRCRGKY